MKPIKATYDPYPDEIAYEEEDEKETTTGYRIDIRAESNLPVYHKEIMIDVQISGANIANGCNLTYMENAKLLNTNLRRHPLVTLSWLQHSTLLET